jgi:serine/threonine-protein kinase
MPDPAPREGHLSDEVLLRYRHRRLDPVERARVEEHLNACPECRDRLEQLTLLSNIDVAAAREAPPPPPDLPDYEFPRNAAGWPVLLGQGGMGVVYKARQKSLNRLVALKMILTSGPVLAEQRIRFRREAQAAAQLQHPNIVAVYEVGEHNDRPYLSMEYVADGSLAARIDHKPQPPREAAQLVETLSRAMHVAHNAGIVHRDLKPGNVLLALPENMRRESPDADLPARHTPLALPAYTPKITDFGLAKLLGDQQQLSLTGNLLGTPNYMAPEQTFVNSNQIGPAADIWALGAILYELLTGFPPFRGETAIDTMHQVRTAEPIAPHLFQRNLPRDLETICLKCLEKEPRNRYASAETLAEDLRRFRAGEPILARRASWIEQTWKWVKRKPLQAALIVLLTLLLGVGGAWWWREDQTASEKADRLAKARSQFEQILDQMNAAWRRAKAATAEGLAPWAPANELLGRARDLLAGHDLGDEVQQRMDELAMAFVADYAVARRTQKEHERDGRMRTAVTKIRLSKSPASVGGGIFNLAPAAEDYVEAFRAYGVEVDQLAVAESLALLRDSKIKETLVAALIDWATLERKAGDADIKRVFRVVKVYHRLIAVAQQLDADDPWHHKFYAALKVAGVATTAVKHLAETTEVAALSPTKLALLGEFVAEDHPAVAVELLGRARRHHREDFWINHHLADALLRLPKPQPERALAHREATVALAPHEPGVLNLLGYAYVRADRLDDALHAFHDALQQQPGFTLARTNLLTALAELGRWEEARREFKEAERLRLTDASVLHAWANVRLRTGHFHEAAAYYRKVRQLLPTSLEATLLLGNTLEFAGEFAQAAAVLKEGERLLPKGHPLRPQVSERIALCERLAREEQHVPAFLARLRADGGAGLSREEKLHQAYLLFGRGYYGWAARLYEAAQGDLGDERQRAACVTAMAAGRRGKDAAESDEAACVRWRRQACAWLRAELEQYREKAQKSTREERVEIRSKLHNLRGYALLADLRESAAAAQLPAEEQAACRKLWTDFDDLVRQLHAHP